MHTLQTMPKTTHNSPNMYILKQNLTSIVIIDFSKPVSVLHVYYDSYAPRIKVCKCFECVVLATHEVHVPGPHDVGKVFSYSFVSTCGQ